MPRESSSSSRRKQALERLSAVRRSGKKQSEDVEMPDEADIYDEVAEDVYQQSYSAAQDRFVVDDHYGYNNDDESDEEAKEAERGKAKLGKKGKKKEKEAKNARVNKAFLHASKSKVNEPMDVDLSKKESPGMVNLDDLLNDLIDDPLGTASTGAITSTPEAPRKAIKTKKEVMEDKVLFEQQARKKITSDDDGLLAPHRPGYVDIDTVDTNGLAKVESKFKDKASPTKSTSKKARIEEVGSIGDMEANSVPAFQSSYRQEEATAAALTGNILDMYWFDAYEDNASPGNIYLLGKTHGSAEGTFVSCCVKVCNVERNVFLLPREHNLKTKEANTAMDVYQEFNEIAKRKQISKFNSKTVERKFAFQSTDAEAPRTATYLKVSYPASLPALPRDLEGNTFSKVLGTHSTPLELFMMKRDLMGPCWLQIHNVESTPSKQTWCRTEYQVSSQKFVSKASTETEPPPMVAWSLDVKTILNEQTKAHEIVLISWLAHRALKTDGTMNTMESLERMTLTRKIGDADWPQDLQETISFKGLLQSVRCFNGERQLLSYFLAMLQKADPDILLGHGISTLAFELLIHRFNEFRIGHEWSKLGRLQRKKLPKRNDAPYALRRGIASGRLICDTDTSSRELIRETNYSLSHLVSTHLGEKRQDIALALVPEFFTSSTDLLKLIDSSIRDALLVFRLAEKLMILPLTKQLTTLCGNLWAQSLRSARAERIEYLLLHEFYRKKYLAPEKYSHSEMKEMRDPKSSGRKKPAYSGGLVLEPKKGFYDDFILLLDFNSLYPSIIQEYDICFTTVPHWTIKEEELSDLQAHFPDKKRSIEGILPRVIAHLVNRRRSVKNMLGSSGKETEQYKQLDIRQKALKLVANSMYGCLGFVNSRFYCKPLAAMVTSLGRLTLSSTVDLAQSLGYDVVYGDTDSIMVNTRTKDLDQANEVGNVIKKEVNRLYSRLEIDIDGVFQSMLLLKKKKYAATIISRDADGSLRKTKELKGLDLVRRDWCPASKEAGIFIVDQILSGDPFDDIIEHINDYLQQLAQDMRNGSLERNKFIITKSLTKPPTMYSDVANHPHVHVALQMMEQGRRVNVGDHIPYIVCFPRDGQDNGSLAARSYHPYALTTPEYADVQIDYEWYLNNQILAPVARLCEPLPDMDSYRVATILGLESQRHQPGEERTIAETKTFSLELYDFNDPAAFEGLMQLSVTCRYCNASGPIHGLCGLQGSDMKLALQCPTDGCRGFVANAQDAKRIENAISIHVRSCLDRFYDRVNVCDEPSCEFKNGTLLLPAMSSSCPRASCSGTLKPAYSGLQAYQQLRYFQALFDVDRLLRKEANKKLGLSVDHEYQQMLYSLKDRVETVLGRCSHHFVDPTSVFAQCF